MWYAWNMDNIILNEEENTIGFKTKADVLWQESCNACDGRKRLTVTKVIKGIYMYRPRNCDGEWGDSIIIVNEKYLKDNQNLKNRFLEYLDNLNLENEKDIEICNKSENNDYYKELINLRENIINVKNQFMIKEDLVRV